MEDNDQQQQQDPVKLCSACGETLPRASFGKKQWMCRRERRCKACVEGNNKSIDKRGQTTVPVRAASHEGLHKRRDPQDSIVAQVAGTFCSWCGKAEETEDLKQCPKCMNIEYCSRACQEAAWPEHKLVCEQLKQDRKSTKKERKKQAKSGEKTITEASGVGSYCYSTVPQAHNLTFITTNGELRGGEQPGTFFASPSAEKNLRNAFGTEKIAFLQSRMARDTAQKRGTYERTEYFSDVTELHPTNQFLLACGTLNDIDLAKQVLTTVLHLIRVSGPKPDGSIPDITDITVRGYNLNALEWAARRGNFAIAQWLATDPRTKIMVTRMDSAPVAWACYTNRSQLARMLVEHGANTPTHLAAENGSLLALKFLVEECGHDIMERDALGMNLCTSLRRNNPVWKDQPGCVAVDEYAKNKGVREYA